MVAFLLAWAGCKTAPLSNRPDAARPSADASIGIPDSSVVGSGGIVPGTGGASGSGGIVGATGGAFGSGGQGTGGVLPGTGGSTPPGTGGSGGSAPSAVTVQLDQTKQTMEGFGIANTWAPAMSESDADALFDPSKGIGLSILRFGMGSSGEPMTSNIYPDIKKASVRGVTTFIATGLSAAASCKQDGHLLASCYESWAATMAAFPDKVKQNTGVALYAMSVQNEPEYTSSDASNTMLYTAEEMVAFVRVLGPKIKALSPAVRVIAPETTEWGRLWTNQSAPGASDPLHGTYDYGHALAKDPDAWALVDIVGTHMYETQVAEPWPSDLPQPKPVWMTEVCGVKGWPEAGPSSDIDNGIAVAGWIHDAIVNGNASAWLWFWYRANSADDNEGLLLRDGTDTKRHYTLGNFSRFIRPGYARVDITGSSPAGVLLSAYKGTDGTVVVVAINKGTSSVTVPIAIAGGTAPASLTPTLTSATDSLAATTPVTLTGGSFTATLASMTVTTFVGK
jgi:glucuronoarabinoxylan endo-1,4-beta-xylanase